MKRSIVPLMLGFGVTLALLIGRQMSADAMAVIVGVAVGVAAGVPASLLVVVLLRRERHALWQSEPPQPASPPLPQPPVIILNPYDFGQRPGQPVYAPEPPPQPMHDSAFRRLRVVGDSEDRLA